MAEPREDSIETALREGLRALPVPDLGRDFDERVIAALRVRRPWWQPLWASARPVISAAACSTVIMLTVLHWGLSIRPPATATHPAPPVSAAPAPASGLTMAALDKALDEPDLSFGSVSLLLASRPPEPASRTRSTPTPAARARPPKPPDRAGVAPDHTPTFA